MTAGPTDLRVGTRWDAAFFVLALACVWPLFYVSYPPIEDLPQHLAALRILTDFHNPELGLERFFVLDLLHTQYLAYYLAADGLAHFIDVELANKLLCASALIALPYAARNLLEALGKDGRLALLIFPLAYNAHLILGFFNFIAAIPLSLYGVAFAVRQRRGPSTTRAVGLALIAFVCFYTHVVPFALMALGVVLVSLSLDLRRSVNALLPLVPAGLGALVWLETSPAGRATLTAARGAERGPRPEFVPYRAALDQLPRWLTDVFAGDQDLQLLYAWLALCVLACLLALIERLLRRSERAPDALAAALGMRLLALPPLCALLYFVAPTSYDWIWPIAQRFPLLCAIWLVIALPRFRLGGSIVFALAFAVSAASFQITGKAFADFEREEVDARDFEAALETIPKGQRVVGLIFDRGSRFVAFAPFIHYVAYYQARKGGAVMFSFADFPQSPFRFRDDNRPPRVPPRWEWLPERVRPRELGFYDYALVRGGPGPIAAPNSGFTAVYGSRRWSVWKHMR